jgi:predicted enzyme related to lactoylglutathione lyase
MGTFAWNELATNDVAACKDFYRDLLGWEARDLPMDGMSYTIFSKDGQDVGGMMAIAAEWGDVPPHWLGYIAVEDVDASAARVENLGGEVMVPPMDVPGVGRFSIIRDAGGAALAIMTFLPME